MDDALDEFIGRWHEFAGQPASIVAGQFEEDGQALVEQVVRELLGETEAFAFTSASDFCEYVVNLRENERAWSRRLGEVMLLAEDKISNREISAAHAVFKEFESSCPWRIFVKIARTQRENTLD